MDIQNTTTNIITTPLSKINQTYCGNDFEDFQTTFRQYHGYISAFVCIFGIVANILNIIVLTRKHMISSFNTLLTSLAVADMIVMLDFLPYTINQYIVVDNIPDVDYFSYDRMVKILICSYVFVVVHAMAIAITLTLAIWRYIAVNYPFKASHWCNMHRTRVAIGICFLLPIIIYIPAFLAFTVKEKSGGIFKIYFTDIALSNDRLLLRIVFWIHGVLTKLIPCFVLTIFSFLLVRGLYKAMKMKKKLIQRPVSDVNGQHVRDRTTKMLLAILVLFLVTEFPSGVMGLMTVFYGVEFYNTCYEYFEEVRTLLTLINSALNIVIYGTMSRQFRETFVNIFNFRICSKWRANDVAKSQEFDTQMSEMTTKM